MPIATNSPTTQSDRPTATDRGQESWTLVVGNDRSNTPPPTRAADQAWRRRIVRAVERPREHRRSRAQRRSGAMRRGVNRLVRVLLGSRRLGIRRQRIVALEMAASGDPLLSVGAPVVGLAIRDGGVNDTRRFYPGAEAIPVVGTPFDVNVEAVAALEPDLITVGSNPNMLTDLALLEEIAPTVVTGGAPGTGDESVIDVVMGLVGEVTGLEDRVAEEKLRAEQAISDLAAAKPDGTLSFAIVGWFDPNIAVFAPNAFGADVEVLRRAGLVFADVVAESTAPYSELISQERILDIEADLFLYLDNREIETFGLFPSHPTVLAGQSHPVPVDASGLSYAAMVRYAEHFLPIVAGADPELVMEAAS